MNRSSRVKIIRRYWETSRAYIRFGFPRTEEDARRQSVLRTQLALAESDMESAGITMLEAYEEKIRQGW